MTKKQDFSLGEIVDLAPYGLAAGRKSVVITAMENIAGRIQVTWQSLDGKAEGGCPVEVLIKRLC